MLSSFFKGILKLWSLSSDREGEEEGEGKEVASTQAHTCCNDINFNCMKVTREGAIITAGSEDGVIKRWSISGPPSSPSFSLSSSIITGHTNNIYCIAMMDNDNKVASGSDDKSIEIFHLSSGTLIMTITTPSRVMSLLSLSSGYLAAGVGGRYRNSGLCHILVYDVTAGAVVKRCEGHSCTINSLLEIGDGSNSRLVSGSGDGTIRIWDMSSLIPAVVAGDSRKRKRRHVPDAICISILTGHSDDIKSLALLGEEGDIIVSGSDDKTIKVWSATSGDCLTTLEGHSDSVNSVSVLGDGRSIAA